MLKLIVKDTGNYVRLTEFYDQLELDKNQYRRFVHSRIRSKKIITSGFDFFEIDPFINGLGRPRREFLISISLLKTLCFEIDSKKAEMVKKWADTIHDFRTYNVR